MSVAVGMTAGDINPRAMSYGYDRVRFVRPVVIGDPITVRAEIFGKSDHRKRPEELGYLGGGHRREPGRGNGAVAGPPPHRLEAPRTRDLERVC